MRFLMKLLAVAMLPLLLATAVQAQLNLLMFDSIGCPYCERWKEEIGVIYSKTPEGRQAPLIITDVDDPLPAEFTIKSPPIYSPTFVLLRDGVEIDRLEGYAGEDFFWGLLENMLVRAEAAKSAS